MNIRVPAQKPRRGKAKIAFLAEAPGASEGDKGKERRAKRQGPKDPHYLVLARVLHPELPWTDQCWPDYEVAEPLPPYPIIGPSGDVFNPGLRQAGIERADCWVGNVFEEIAPNNDVTPWMRDPVRLAEAKARLAEELIEAGANVIVPLGATALEVLTGRKDISKAAGAPTIATDVVPGVKLVPNYHPAYILRMWKMLPIFLAGLDRARREAERGPHLHYPWREFTLEPDLAEIKRWMWQGKNVDSRGKVVPSLLNSERLAVDIETGWGQITCIGFAPDEEHAICIPFVDVRKPSRSYWGTVEEEAAAWELVRTVCESDVPKVMQNGTYDTYWLLERMGIRCMNYRDDTRLMSHALFPELPKDLATLIALYSECPQTKHWGNRSKDEKRDA